MRVFVAGATGAIGRRLVPLLIAEGHQVTGMTRSGARGEQLRTQGAQPVIADALDGPAVRAAVAQAEPDAVIHLLTSIPARIDPRHIERDFELNDRLRGEGTRHLVVAASEAGAHRIVAQSIAFAYAPGPQGTLHREEDPIISGGQAPRTFRRSAGAIEELERVVTGAKGIVLRFGYLYGPGTAFSSSGSSVEDVRRRRFPVVGHGQGVWSFLHVIDAARAILAALEHDGPAIYNVVDDEPARVADWLPVLARAVNAPAPRRVPAFVARPLAGEYGIAMMTRAQGASGERARLELGFAPAHPKWREGFQTALD